MTSPAIEQMYIQNTIKETSCVPYPSNSVIFIITSAVGQEKLINTK